ncbi:hypothetical protein K504DRAFT_534653 [Pleomassaria siparia CBS 279.74]|uniref:Clr5 domain-containing protein n=1 Tax=Pleomassaria siparia CBS 279.74 TaxID=1314801 RepID=A0A6G1K8N0_9PLEO|nr:hypothetical protein K504DRAFT_534653 [Pleomassaria siparia CBS 279.74]
MAQPQQKIRFVTQQAPRAKQIPRATWNGHETEIRALHPSLTLEELMGHMKNRHGFNPSRRQYIYQLDKWGLTKYNTSLSTREIPPQPLQGSRCSPHLLNVSPPDQLSPAHRPAALAAPKRSKSMGSLQSRDSARNSVDGRPVVPPKKRLKLTRYMDSRDSLVSPLADLQPDAHSLSAPGYQVIRAVTPTPRRPPLPSKPSNLTPRRPVSTIHALASVGLQFASTGQPTSSNTSPLETSSSQSLHSNSINIGSYAYPNTPGLVDDDSDWTTEHDCSDSDMFLPGSIYSPEIGNGKAIPTSPLPRRRRFDSSRPIHTFSLEELSDMKTAAHFLRSLGFDSDAFELLAILLKQCKEQSMQPAHIKTNSMINMVRSAYSIPQMEIARHELLQTLEQPRDASTDAEHFLYRMLLAETYSRSSEEENEQFLSEIAIGYELASDRMLDKLPEEHRCYDVLMYHYLNKCSAYFNSNVKDARDGGTVFASKEHIQLRLIERLPGPFELRRGSMGNPCLRSCLQWCTRQLSTVLALPDSWRDLQSNDGKYADWTDHIGLYCALWERWHKQRRNLRVQLNLWMKDAEERMGIMPAELLSVVCGLVMGAAPPRDHTGANLTARARTGLQLICAFSDKDIACRFLDTFSSLGTLLDSALQRQYHDPISFFASLINSTHEREAFGDRARVFSRSFIEKDLNMTLPVVQRDIEPLTRRATHLSVLLPGSAMQSSENLAMAISPYLGGSSTHSSEYSAMRLVADHMQQAHRSLDQALAAPASVARAAHRSRTSITATSISQLSHLTSTLSLTSTQEAARDFIELFAGYEANPFERPLW